MAEGVAEGVVSPEGHSASHVLEEMPGHVLEELPGHVLEESPGHVLVESPSLDPGEVPYVLLTCVSLCTCWAVQYSTGTCSVVPHARICTYIQPL